MIFEKLYGDNSTNNSNAAISAPDSSVSQQASSVGASDTSNPTAVIVPAAEADPSIAQTADLVTTPVDPALAVVPAAEADPSIAPTADLVTTLLVIAPTVIPNADAESAQSSIAKNTTYTIADIIDQNDGDNSSVSTLYLFDTISADYKNVNNDKWDRSHPDSSVAVNYTNKCLPVCSSDIQSLIQSLGVLTQSVDILTYAVQDLKNWEPDYLFGGNSNWHNKLNWLF